MEKAIAREKMIDAKAIATENTIIMKAIAKQEGIAAEATAKFEAASGRAISEMEAAAQGTAPDQLKAQMRWRQGETKNQLDSTGNLISNKISKEVKCSKHW